MAVLAASLLLAIAISTASASRLSVSHQTFRIAWSSLEFLPLEELSEARCSVILEGSFHARSIAKAASGLIGAITHAMVATSENCNAVRLIAFNGSESYNGTASPNTLPWHLTYGSFTGTLPNIATVRLMLSRFRFGLVAAGLCVGQYGTVEDSLTLSANLGASRAVTSLSPAAGSRITLVRRDGGVFCSERVRIGPSPASFTVLGAATLVTVTLI
jgi:hypothetical protein